MKRASGFRHRLVTHRFAAADRDRDAALFYSLIEAARLSGVEPRAYLGDAARRAIRHPGAVTLARDLKSLAGIVRMLTESGRRLEED